MFGGNATYIHLAAHAHPAALAVAALLALAWSVALVIVDLRQQRLPNALTLPAGAVTVALCFFFPTGWWGLLWPGLYLFSPQGVGGGDVKLALPLAMVCVISGKLPAVLVAIGVSGLFTVLMAWLSRSRTVAHGPSMLATTWLVVMYFGV